MKTKQRWAVRRVYRSDAGGYLVAPVDVNTEREHGITPSYNIKAMQGFVDRLNGVGPNGPLCPKCGGAIVMCRCAFRDEL